MIEASHLSGDILQISPSIIREEPAELEGRKTNENGSVISVSSLAQNIINDKFVSVRPIIDSNRHSIPCSHESQNSRKSTSRKKKLLKGKTHRKLKSLDTMDLEKMERIRRMYNL